tara:strand:- start:4497 stop:4922 length:426 start_codon:yes stop_codon:yes gene_type:complete
MDTKKIENIFLSNFKKENYVIIPVFEKNEFLILIKRHNDIIVVNNFNEKNLLKSLSLNDKNENIYHIQYKDITSYSVEFKNYKDDFFKSKLVINIILNDINKLSFFIDTPQRLNLNNLITENINDFISIGINSFCFTNEIF